MPVDQRRIRQGPQMLCRLELRGECRQNSKWMCSGTRSFRIATGSATNCAHVVPWQLGSAARARRPPDEVPGEYVLIWLYTTIAAAKLVSPYCQSASRLVYPR